MTQQIVKDAITVRPLFGYDVKTITVEGVVYYVASSVFKHFGIVFSEVFRNEYGTRFPGLSSRTLVTYAKLHQYCQLAVTQNRIKKKTRLMVFIADHDQASVAAPESVNKEALKLPDTVTTEAAQLKKLVDDLGIARLCKILDDLGVLPPGKQPEQPSTERRKVVITVEY